MSRFERGADLPRNPFHEESVGSPSHLEETASSSPSQPRRPTATTTKGEELSIHSSHSNNDSSIRNTATLSKSPRIVNQSHDNVPACEDIDDDHIDMDNLPPMVRTPSPCLDSPPPAPFNGWTVEEARMFREKHLTVTSVDWDLTSRLSLSGCSSPSSGLDSDSEPLSPLSPPPGKN